MVAEDLKEPDPEVEKESVKRGSKRVSSATRGAKRGRPSKKTEIVADEEDEDNTDVSTSLVM